MQFCLKHGLHQWNMDSKQSSFSLCTKTSLFDPVTTLLIKDFQIEGHFSGTDAPSQKKEHLHVCT